MLCDDDWPCAFRVLLIKRALGQHWSTTDENLKSLLVVYLRKRGTIITERLNPPKYASRSTTAEVNLYGALATLGHNISEQLVKLGHTYLDKTLHLRYKWDPHVSLVKSPDYPNGHIWHLIPGLQDGDLSDYAEARLSQFFILWHARVDNVVKGHQEFPVSTITVRHTEGTDKILKFDLSLAETKAAEFLDEARSIRDGIIANDPDSASRGSKDAKHWRN